MLFWVYEIDDFLKKNQNDTFFSFCSLKTPKTDENCLSFIVMSDSVFFFFHYILGDVENFEQAKPLVTPVHIKPEWYCLFAAILRSIPNKLGGGGGVLLYSLREKHQLN